MHTISEFCEFTSKCQSFNTLERMFVIYHVECMIIFPFDYKRLFLKNFLILISDVKLFLFLVIWLLLFFPVYINYFSLFIYFCTINYNVILLCK